MSFIIYMCDRQVTIKVSKGFVLKMVVRRVLDMFMFNEYV